MQIIKDPQQQKRPLPEYDLPRPADLNVDSEHCLIYPLFIANDNDFEQEAAYRHYLINSAFWAAHSWRVNSNCIERKWNIYFFVENRLYEQPSVREQFEKANLTDFIILFDAVPGDAVRNKFGLKLYATLHPAFDNFKRAYMSDADTFLASKFSKIVDVDGILYIGEDESLFNILSATQTDKFEIMRSNYYLNEKDTQELVYKHIKTILGIDLDKSHGFRGLGGILAWNPTLLRDDFKEMVRSVTPHVSHDETQYAIYRIMVGDYNEDLSACWENKLEWVGFMPHYLDNPYTYFLEHVVLEAGEREQGYEESYNAEPYGSLWRKWSGLEKRL